MKRLEANLPKHLRVHVVHLHEGNVSRNQLKKIGHTNARYVTIARLLDDDTVVAEGLSACSQKDNPSRKIGRAVAIGRALASYEGAAA